MDYLIRFTQLHETFRLPEIQALAIVEGVDMSVVSYSLDSPFCIIHISNPDPDAAAAALTRRSILTQSIHEHWGSGADLPALHADIRSRSAPLWPRYAACSFKFAIDSFQGTRSPTQQLALIHSLDFLPFAGPIVLRRPDEEFTIFEEWAPYAVPRGLPDPERYHLGRYVADGARDLVREFDLKKRRYISTTSMDSELALVTANIALAAPGRVFYDPFVGTGSFPIAAARFGAVGWGSDIDGRSLRGEGGGKTIKGNFEQYGLLAGLGGVFSADLTNCPMRRRPLGPTSASSDGTNKRPPIGLFDGIVCDPPYGVREGLKVLGIRDPENATRLINAGIQKYKSPDFVPPKKPYSFMAMLDDILHFAAETLVDGGRLAFWMPTANDEEQEIPLPAHPCLEVVAVCTQVFRKWSRRLITYRRLPDSTVDKVALEAVIQERDAAASAAADGRTGSVDELNPFRKGYFAKFQSPSASAASSPSQTPVVVLHGPASDTQPAPS